MKKIFIAIFLSLWAAASFAAAATESPSLFQSKLRDARARHLSSDPAWRALLHYEHDILGRVRSTVDDPQFFLSRSGATHPQKELEATLAAFVEGKVIDDQPAVCRFPARFDWLNEKLDLSLVPSTSCPRYEEWRAKLNPTSVSLVFASYYLNNPASMYGHTFLKLGRGGYEAGEGLLDYTVNFAAVTNTKNGLFFAARGLTGLYRGRFSTEPYYMKMQQYNNMDSRDLWEYQLNASTAEVNRLVRHLWELGPVSMSYFFFNKNCSYQLLPLLDVALPISPTARRFRFRAIPLDTLRAVVDQPGLLKSVRFRPSHVHTMLKRRSFLSREEISLAKQLLVDMSDRPLQKLQTLSLPRQALVLDSAYDLLRYRYGFYRNQSEAVETKERRLLSLRQEIPPEKARTVDLTYSSLDPREGHGTGRWGLAVGADRNRGFQELSVRGAIHDLEADPTGYIEGSQLEMFNVRARHWQNPDKVSLEELTLVQIFSLTPWDPWVHPPSWRVKTGFESVPDVSPDPARRLSYNVRGGSGVTFDVPLIPRARWYAMWDGDTALAHAFHDGYRLGVGGRSGFLWSHSSRWRLHLYGSALRYFAGNPGNRVELSLVQSVTLTKNSELRLILKRDNSYQEGMLGLYSYW